LLWDQDGIVLIDYLPKSPTINAGYCSSLLVQLEDILKEKRRGNVTKCVLFLYDNAPARRALATQKKLAYLGFKCLDHPPYSPDLAPSDYKLFTGLKNNCEVSRLPQANSRSNRNADLLTLINHPPPPVLTWLLAGDWLVSPGERCARQLPEASW
jgi:hypothetical protein